MRALFRHIPLLLTVALFAVACANDTAGEEDPIPEGYGRLALTIATPETVMRGVGTPAWLEGTPEERAINRYVLLMCNGTSILQVFTNDPAITWGGHDATNHYYPSTTTFTSDNIPTGNYTLTFYCLANFTDAMLTDVFGSTTIGNALPSNFEDKAVKMSNTATLPTGGIPMSGTLVENVTILPQQTTTITDKLILWRMMAKMEFDFINESAQSMEILGIEIEPVNDGTVGTPLIQSADLSSEDNDLHGGIKVVEGVQNKSWKIESAASDPHLVNVLAKSGSTNGTATYTVYLNETDASYTAVNNQFSLRFKVRRGGTVTEYRYAITLPYISGTSDGFNVIRRNDWIKIPIHFTDWQFQIEALPFPPIAGFQARMVTADAQSITFNSGGYITLAPRFRKSDDPEGTWRGLEDADITLDLPTAEDSYTTDGNKVSWIDGTSNTGLVLEGDLNILEQRLVKLPSGDIVGKLTNEEEYGTVTVTLKVKLGSDPKYEYQFTYNIIKKKTS
ncbi:MAG: hypothetical protein IJ190_12810 [Prevotella sp.]|nr:hypothetical protein [Prevotella sp.]